MTEVRILNDRYEVGKLIGRGGMADVYYGRDQRLGREVAVKMMRPDLARDPQFQSRFRREAQSSAALNHPNIVAVFDTGQEEYEDTDHHGVACPYMVMEYVTGATLRKMLRAGQVTTDDAVEWTCGVLDALSYSHEKSIVHRDIKPANVMVTLDGEVKVMDFGIARALNDSTSTMTQTQAVVGTAQYLSPEQARGEKVDYRSDLYSAGCLLFELLTGRPPFVGDSPVSVAYQHVREQPPTASALNPEVSPAMDSVLAKALTKDVDQRFQTAAEFHEALTQAHLNDQSTTVMAATPRNDNSQQERTQAFSPIAANSASNTPPQGIPAAPVPPANDVWDQDPVENKRKEKKSKKKAIITVVAIVVVLLLAVGGWAIAREVEKRNIEASQVDVPDVSEMSETDARNTLTQAGLRPIVDEKHDDVDKDQVIDTDPASGETVQENDEVTMNVSLGPDQVTLPEDLRGSSEATVRDTLEGLSLTITDINYVESADIERDRLVETAPELGSTVPYDSTVSLQMSSGEVSVPDVRGQTEDQARANLDEMGLSMSVNKQETSDATEGTVFNQDAIAGTSVPQGSTVSVTVAVKPKPSPSPSSSSSSSSSSSGSSSPSPSESSSSPSPSESDSESPSPSPSPSPSDDDSDEDNDDEDNDDEDNNDEDEDSSDDDN